MPDGTTECLNQRWLDYTGLPFEASLGWGWKVSIHPDDIGRVMETWRRLLASGEPGAEEARLRRFDGPYRWFLFRAVPVRDEQGTVVRWYGTNTDIEDRKQVETLLAAEKRTQELIRPWRKPHGDRGRSVRRHRRTPCSTSAAVELKPNGVVMRFFRSFVAV